PIQEARFALLGHALEPEALVRRNPGDDAGMSEVARHRFPPLMLEAPLRGFGMLMKSRHLAPDQEPKSVRPVQPARVLDLLVLTRAVEPHRLGEHDVAREVAIIGSGEEAFGEISLV